MTHLEKLLYIYLHVYCVYRNAALFHFSLVNVFHNAKTSAVEKCQNMYVGLSLSSVNRQAQLQLEQQEF